MFLTINPWASPMLSTGCILVFKLLKDFLCGISFVPCLVSIAFIWQLYRKTQEPITNYTYDGYKEKDNYKRSNSILITYKSKQYTLHTGNKILDKIKSGDFPNLYYSSKTDYLFFEGDYLPIGYAEVALLFTIIFPTVGIVI